RKSARATSYTETRPWATYLMILVPAIVMLVRVASDFSLGGFGALVVPLESEWWRFLTAPYIYDSVGYLFAVALAVVIFVPKLERRLGSIPVFILLAACGSLGMLAAYGVEDQRGVLDFIGGGNGIALGAIAAWYVVERHETADFEDEKPDIIGILVCVAVILLLPLVVPTANVWSALAGGAVGALAGLAATLVRR
ncbi:MAG: rhomboid family intramembrane serine protease, partial [Solirubrobacterales bacterium]